MDISSIILIIGFCLAAYSVVGNDVIQTLGTFLASNDKKPWWVLYIFGGSIFLATLLYGWFNTRPIRAQLIDKTYWKSTSDTTRIYEYQELKKLFGKPLVYEYSWKKIDQADKEALPTSPYQAVKVYQPSSNGTFKIVGVDSVRHAALFKIERKSSNRTDTVTLASYHARDASYNRLEKYDEPTKVGWWFILPPLILMLITRAGIPVSTTFMILTFFEPKNLWETTEKSILGYIVAFVVAIIVYLLITKTLEKRFIERGITKREEQVWTVLQWVSTGFLWTQWLIQDFANIFVYLPRDINPTTLVLAILGNLLLLGFIFFQKGGRIQKIVKSKYNSSDVRSATIIDFIYGFTLFFFTELNNIPMSTTWVFIGMLSGREIAMRLLIDKTISRDTLKMVGYDLGRVTFGLVVSIALVYVVRLISTGSIM
jgi:phosphate/sulfate permease